MESTFAALPVPRESIVFPAPDPQAIPVDRNVPEDMSEYYLHSVALPLLFRADALDRDALARVHWQGYELIPRYLDMNPSPDPASPSEEAPKLVPNRYYAHLSEQREEQEEAALLLPEQRLFPFVWIFSSTMLAFRSVIPRWNYHLLTGTMLSRSI
jgi:hypothetical protein